MKKEIEFAESLAKEYHKGQKRFDGSDYITHLQGVVNLVDKKHNGIVIVAWLHDILEDTPMTADKLAELGIRKDLIDSIVAITKKEDETYLDYILRCSKNLFAKEVKIADLKHNLSNLKKGSMRDKYILALYILENRTSNNINKKKRFVSKKTLRGFFER
jgi:(p)ppGpp synthase/HD superfamily hydrolase